MKSLKAIQRDLIIYIWWRGWGGDDGAVVMKVGMATADGGVVAAATVAVDDEDGGDGCGGVEVVLLWRWLPWR
ncbi:hypothetical protein Tco_1165707 [Tanacetum coccineum]